MVNISLKIDHEKLLLVVNDNGEGFIEGTKNKKPLGILGMRERTSIMEGEYNIISTPGKGTQVEVMIPVDNEV